MNDNYISFVYFRKIRLKLSVNNYSNAMNGRFLLILEVFLKQSV